MSSIEHGDLKPFSPDPEALARHLRPVVTDVILRRIASLDYGYESKKHFAALKRLRDAPAQQKRLRWYPLEVLQLGIVGPPFPNYSDTSTAAHNAGDDDIAYAFILACLLRTLPWITDCSANGLLLRVSNHLLRLSQEVPEIRDIDIGSVFSWLIQADPAEEDLAFLAVWLIHAALSGRIEKPPHTIAVLARWAHGREIDSEAIRLRQYNHFNRDHLFRLWGDIGESLRNTDLSQLPDDAQTAIRDIGSLLAR